MIDAKTLSPSDRIFTHVDDNGTTIHIHAPKLREYCLRERPKIFLTEVTTEFANYMLENKSVDFMRVLSLTDKECQEPILYCKDGTFTDGRPDVFLVDGHHRYVRAVLERKTLREAWILEEEVWRPFTIVGIRNLTQDQLRKVAIAHRDAKLD